MARSDKFTLTQKKQQLYSDFLTSFAYNKHTGYLGVIENEDSVAQALKNFFLTNHGERFMNASFGGNVTALLFENYDRGMAEATTFTIREGLAHWEPRVSVHNIQIAPANTENSGAMVNPNELIVSLTYAIRNLYGEEHLDVLIKRVR